jgi:hypothetical protein
MMRGLNPLYPIKSSEKKAIQKAQLRTAASTVAMMMAFKTLLTVAALGFADDDDEISWNFNPTSTDFMRVRIDTDTGTYRLDPTLGMGAGIVLASRLILGVVTDSNGEMHPLRDGSTLPTAFKFITGREGEVKSGRYESLVTDFFKYKMSPIFGSIRMMTTGKDIMGNAVAWGGEHGLEGNIPFKSLAPLVIQDFQDVSKVYPPGHPMWATFGLSAFLGWPGSGIPQETDALGTPLPRPIYRAERDDEGARIDF